MGGDIIGYIEDLRSKIGHQPVILSGAGVAVLNDKNEILFVKKFGGQWGIPGGFMELGESAEEAGRREVFEETGILIGNLTLVTVVSGPQSYTKLKNNDEYYSVTIVYMTNEIIGGTLKPDGVEVEEAKFFNINRLPEKLNPFIASMIKQHLQKK